MFFDEIDTENDWFVQIFNIEEIVGQVSTFNYDLDIKLHIHLQLVTSYGWELFSAEPILL